MSRWRWLPQPPGHLAVAVTGPAAAPPVVLLHGFLADGRAWRDVVNGPNLPPRRWLAVDLPGHGRSAGIALAKSENPWLALLDLLDRSLSNTLHGPFALVGYSAGGRVAAWWALHGQLSQKLGISALVLESAHPGLLDVERPARLAQDQQRARDLASHGLTAFVDAWQRLPLFASQLGCDQTTLGKQRRLRLAQTASGLVDHLQTLGNGAMPRLDTLPPRTHLPAIVLSGQLDTAYCALLPRWSQLLPAAQLRVVAGAGHNVHLEAPGPWQHAVAEALGGQ